MSEIKGYISSQKTVWCGKCVEWEYIDNTKNARQLGWKLTKKYGWVCPSCNVSSSNTEKLKEGENGNKNK